MNVWVPLVLDVLTVAFLAFGLAFMFLGALGILRLPDFYGRAHAGSKCVTLGISGMLLAAVCHLANPTIHSPGLPAGMTAGGLTLDDRALGAVTKTVLVILFQFVAAPVAAHMLSRAAHADGVRMGEPSFGDELDRDVPAVRPPRPTSPPASTRSAADDPPV